ncbi:LytTR family transcriptional regulator DNA-binding domain-containing protein [Spongiimicrobium sp. 3-5]|uniref:LytTR family transcriptional regulator DNA-binding domain-containing protein n=1 Tax=Spongiimicrobium sp. 3-5 TaxID=3332596 RepID=UPI00397FDF86
MVTNQKKEYLLGADVAYKNATMKLLKSINYWRLLEPILLGSVANMVVNFVFDPSNPDFILKEFLVAIAFSVPITELYRLIDLRLEKKYSWTISPKKRFGYNLLYLTLALLFTINVLGNAYIVIIGDDFYTWQELLTINLITFFVALLLTLVKWTTHFYKKWKLTAMDLDKSDQKFNELSSKLDPKSHSIKLLRKNDEYISQVKDIRMAKSEFGVVKVFMVNGEFYIFHGTLSKLASLLPEELFFPVTRSLIIHHQIIISIASSTYGKVSVKVEEMDIDISNVTVSRPKASTFRKWYHSTLTLN